MNDVSNPSAKVEAASPYHHGNLKETLLEAAEAELSSHGIEQLSLRAIAKRAGVSHAAPAHHFGDVNGMLTALAARGFERFIAAQQARQKVAAPDPSSQLTAAGLGYIDFALANPALFRLMFSSRRPDFENPSLYGPSKLAFDMLVEGVSATRGKMPPSENELIANVASVWSMVHGLADLLTSERLKSLQALKRDEREAMLIGIIQRAMLPRPKS
ncbi:MAG TPA: TetR/AcrR family transcriptional regulator [Hyphomicrobiales bacterium]|nr:TetR/AcrR family transcriptional regulator [Hyphomicrobiales bacterium]